MTAICQTVTGATMRELRASRDAVTDADLVELRLDGVEDVDVAGALEGRRRPVIVTCRPTWEGGRFDGAEETRLALLAQAVRGGAEHVDVEWRADRRTLPSNPRTKIVLSHHQYDGVPVDLAARVAAMRSEQPDVLKVAVMARQAADCVTLRRAVGADGAHVAIAMGTAGRLTRVWPAWLGSCWTYAGEIAPGQLSARELIDTYRVRTTTASTVVYGLGGAPVAHSASPAMHNAAFHALGIDAVYVPIETPAADEFFAVSDALGLRGASITAPLKRDVAARCDTRDQVATAIGAVNTVRRDANGWSARNFDVDGFLAPLDRRGLAPAGRRAVVFGAGGAARAVTWALRTRGARVDVVARRRAAAEQLAREFEGVGVTDWPPPMSWDLLVNATPVGTVGPLEHDTPAEVADGGGKTVYDLVYNPADTRLLRDARAAGATTIGGLEMLVEQAARQFEWWIDRPAPRAEMTAAATAFLGMTPHVEADHV